MEPGQRYLAPKPQVLKLKAGEYFVEKIVGVEESEVGRKYKVRWQGYPGQDSWARLRSQCGWSESFSGRVLACTWRADAGKRSVQKEQKMETKDSD